MVTRFECEDIRVEEIAGLMNDSIPKRVSAFKITDKNNNNDVTTVQVFTDGTVVVKGNIKSIFRHMHSASDLPIR